MFHSSNRAPDASPLQNSLFGELRGNLLTLKKQRLTDNAEDVTQGQIIAEETEAFSGGSPNERLSLQNTPKCFKSQACLEQDSVITGRRWENLKASSEERLSSPFSLSNNMPIQFNHSEKVDKIVQPRIVLPENLFPQN